MTVKDLFLALDFSEIVEALIKAHEKSLRPISEYKENYDIVCNTEFSGKGGTITFKADGDSDVYMIEGDRYENIVGMEVVIPKNCKTTKAEAAAEILWSSAPFGRITSAQWNYLFEDIFNPSKANDYILRAKRINILIDLPYCRDKQIRKELKKEMESPYEDLQLSFEASRWFIADKRRKTKHNRSKRKREYRLKKRYDELIRLNKAHEHLAFQKAKIGDVPEKLEKSIMNSTAIDTICYQSHVFGLSDRIGYIADLLQNPMYRSKDYLT